MAELAHPTLLVAAGLATGIALVYLHVGRVMVKRAATGSMRRALNLFALWWIATAINILFGALANSAAAFEWTNLRLHVAYLIVQRLLLAISLVGLLYYLLTVVRGRASLRLLVAVYGAYFVFLMASVYYNQPVDVAVGSWRTDVEYARAPDGFGVADVLSLLLLILPTVGLSIAAIVVARRLPEDKRALRNRMTLVGLALSVWWIVAVFAGQRELFTQDWYQLINRLVGLAMALIILVAYSPPAWLQRHITLPTHDEPASTRAIHPR